MALITPEMLNAFNHVKSIYPEITMVIINNQGQWNYCDRNFDSPKFNNEIDISILEDGANSIIETPFVYETPFEEDEM